MIPHPPLMGTSRPVREGPDHFPPPSMNAVRGIQPHHGGAQFFGFLELHRGMAAIAKAPYLDGQGAVILFPMLEGDGETLKPPVG